VPVERQALTPTGDLIYTHTSVRPQDLLEVLRPDGELVTFRHLWQMRVPSVIFDPLGLFSGLFSNHLEDMLERVG
jgi:hypothetical protein